MQLNEASTQNYEFLVDDLERQPSTFVNQRQLERYFLFGEKLTVYLTLKETLTDLTTLHSSLEEACRTQERIMQTSGVAVQPRRIGGKRYQRQLGICGLKREIDGRKGDIVDVVQVLQNHNVEVCRVYQKEL